MKNPPSVSVIVLGLACAKKVMTMFRSSGGRRRNCGNVFRVVERGTGEDRLARRLRTRAEVGLLVLISVRSAILCSVEGERTHCWY